MKRYTDYTQRELANMNSQEIEDLVDIECAIEGIPTTKVKKSYVKLPPVPEPDITIYKIEYFPDFLSDINEAQSLLDFIKGLKSSVTTDYDFDSGIERKYARVKESVPCISDKKVYSEKLYKESKKRFEAERKAKKWNSEIDRNNRTKEIEEIRDNILDAIQEAAFEESKYMTAKNTYLEYLRISGGNKDIAEGFFAKTEYADYLDRILSEESNGTAGEPDAD